MRRYRFQRSGGAAIEYVLGFAMMTVVMCALFQLARLVMGTFFDLGAMSALRPWL